MSEKRIKVLSSIVANQIAAGEVVERPSSVVKELLENSLDAGATRIALDIQAGGAGKIRIVDNGEGIAKDQLKLAFTRHATSKMAEIEDLDRMATFGFRGEALPSIASVSKTTVRSRQAADVAGALLKIIGGEVVEEQEAGCPVGVDIEVAELFYNTPARLKFLKKESTESSHCAEALIREALLRPEVAFTMRSNGRKVRELLRVEKAEERVAALFPKEKLMRAEGAENGVSVLAILGPPERARAGAGSLYTYVNQRFVRDKTLLKAVTQAFAGTLEHGRYPVGLVSIDLPMGGLDVNVHPQKIEVRFSDPNTVFRSVSRVIGEMVARGAWSFSPSAPDRVAEQPTEIETDPALPSPTEKLVPPPINYPSQRPMPVRDSAYSDTSRSVKTTDGGHSAALDYQTATDLPRLPIPQSPTMNRDNARYSCLKFLGQAKELFLLCEDDDDLVIIDQHAAHERVTYEKLRQALSSGRVSSQRLLVSHTINLGPADADRIMSHQTELARLGMEVDRFGADTISVKSIPAELSSASPDRLLADMVLAIEEGRKDTKGEMEEKVLSTMACHGSIRAGRSVDPRETLALLEQMDAVDFSGHCPHGRPVLTRIPWRDIRRRLGRG